MTITEQDLARLLEAKDAATEASEKAYSLVRQRAGGSLSERLTADIAYKKAAHAKFKAEDAYSTAIHAFLMVPVESV